MLTESLPLYESQPLLPPLTAVFGISHTIPALLASPHVPTSSLELHGSLVVPCPAVGFPFLHFPNLLSGDQVQSSQSPSGGEPLSQEAIWQLGMKNTHLGPVYP